MEAVEETGTADPTPTLEDGTTTTTTTTTTDLILTPEAGTEEAEGHGTVMTDLTAAVTLATTMVDLTQTRGAGATAITMDSGATAEATAGATMLMMEARGGQTLTPEVTMAEVKTAEVTGPEAGLGSRLHLPRTRGQTWGS